MNRAERRRQRQNARKTATAVEPSQSAGPSSKQQTLIIQQSLDLAVKHHNAGDLHKAEGIYQQILQADPNQPVALHLLGVIAHQLGKSDIAVNLITKVLATNPDYAEAHNNLGNVFKELRKLDQAVASYLRAIAINPDYAETHNNLGNVFNKLRKQDEAVASYLKALAINPDYAEAHYNLGNALRELGKLDEALASYHKAIVIKPDYAKAHSSLGTVLQDLGQLDEALVEYRRTLELDPSNSFIRHMVSALTGETTETSPKDYVRELFDDYALRFDDHLVNNLDYKIPVLMRLAVDHLTNGEGTFKRALDLGCGTGMVAQNFRDVAEEMHGVDLSPKMIEGARRKEVFDALYVEDVIEFLEHPERGSFKYDLIIAAELFVYIGSLKTIFAAVAKVIATGGMFVFSVETLEKGDYKLLATGRYSQSAAYIEKLASANDFSIELRDPVVLRNAKPSPIAGNLFILRAAAQ